MKRKLRALLLFSLPYILTALIPLASVLLLSSATVEEYNQKFLTDRQESLQSAFRRFTDRIHTLENKTLWLAQNDIVTGYAFDSILGNGHTAYDNYEFQNLLADYWMNEDATTVLFYDARYGTVVSSSVSLSNEEDFFKYSYRLSGMTHVDHLSRMKNMISHTGYSPVVDATVNNANHKILEYRLKLPTNAASSNHMCQLVVLIRADRIFSDVLDLMEPGGELYFFSGEGTLIYSSGNAFLGIAEKLTGPGYQSLPEVGMDAMSFVSSDGKWILRVISPQMRYGRIPGYVGGLVALSLFASTVLTAYFTVKNFRQLRDVLEIFTGRKTEILETDYRQIKSHAEKIISDNSRYREEMVRYVNSRKYHLTDMLLRGTYESEEKLLAEMEQGGIRIPSGPKAVLCIRYGQGGKLQQEQIREVLARLGQTNPIVFQTALGESVCIFLPGESGLLENICCLEADLTQVLEGPVYVASGSPVEALNKLSLAWSQAKTVLRYREITLRPVHLYSQVSDLVNECWLPERLEERMQNLLLGDQSAESRRVVVGIYEKNFGPAAPLLNFRAIERLRAALKDMLLSLADRYDVPVENEILQAESSGSIPDFFDMVYICLDKLADQLAGRNKTSAQLLAQRVREYVDENFCRGDLSLIQIAEKLEIHEKYVSRVFKTEFGENLSSYVEFRRIEKACELLQSTNMLIAEIAEAVGYSSDLSFRRAFKKLKDISPATYRNNVCNEERTVCDESV